MLHWLCFIEKHKLVAEINIIEYHLELTFDYITSCWLITISLLGLAIRLFTYRLDKLTDSGTNILNYFYMCSGILILQGTNCKKIYRDIGQTSYPHHLFLKHGV